MKTTKCFTFLASSFPGDVGDIPGRPSHPIPKGCNVGNIDDLPYVLVLGAVVSEGITTEDLFSFSRKNGSYNLASQRANRWENSHVVA